LTFLDAGYSRHLGRRTRSTIRGGELLSGDVELQLGASFDYRLVDVGEPWPRLVGEPAKAHGRQKGGVHLLARLHGHNLKDLDIAVIELALDDPVPWRISLAEVQLPAIAEVTGDSHLL
jgi:hypothetical protein